MALACGLNNDCHSLIKDNRIMTDKAALIIDEDKIHCKGVALAMKEIFIEISSTNNPYAAIANLKNKPESVVVTDIKFSMLEGMELVDSISELVPASQIIICSSFLTQAQKTQLLNKGIQHFFEKPLEIEVLKNTVRQLL
jgi:DNA-binding NtrC family response regulator